MKLAQAILLAPVGGDAGGDVDEAGPIRRDQGIEPELPQRSAGEPAAMNAPS